MAIEHFKQCDTLRRLIGSTRQKIKVLKALIAQSESDIASIERDLNDPNAPKQFERGFKADKAKLESDLPELREKLAKQEQFLRDYEFNFRVLACAGA